jgi:hypothetical protein
MEEKRKSRNIPLQEYISVLQFEYLSYKVRSKIFEQPYCDKYKEFCKKKKETIESFSLKMGRPCIFNNENVFQKYVDEFFRDGFGLPDFKYRDGYQEEQTSTFDAKYYFSEGVTVMYQGQEYFVSRNLCKRGIQEKKISIQQKGKPWKIVDIKEVMRVDYLKLI